MFKEFFKFSLKASLLVIASFVLTHCGQQGGSGSCGANVVDGMALSVTHISGNSYRFALCDNMQNPAQYTVYGGVSSSQMGWRQKAITAFQTNNSFQVDFASTDTIFAIYYDTDNGGGYYTQAQDPQHVIVKPRPLPN